MKNNIQILKKFDGNFNYFNPSGLNGKVIYRREKKIDNFIVSDIVDQNDNILIEAEHWGDKIYSYEDPRFIKNNLISINRVEYIMQDDEYFLSEVNICLFDVKTKKLTICNNFNNIIEKNWQFSNNKIVHSIDPFIILKPYRDNQDYNIDTYKENNWSYWINKYGIPRLSTNLIKIDDYYILFFHSHIKRCRGINLVYYNGIAKLNNNFELLGYYKTPINIKNKILEQIDYKAYFEWKRKCINFPYIAETIFFTNAEKIDNKLNIYAGFNDCAALKIEIEMQSIQKFLNKNLNAFKKF